MSNEMGLMHIYHGSGKVKTTALIGLAVRAAGRGFKVCILQFLKGRESGEIKILQNIPNITIIKGDITPKFSFKMTEEEKRETTMAHNDMLLKAISACRGGDCDLLIMDELLDALNLNLVDSGMVFEFLKTRGNVEVAMSGRDPSDALCGLSDYISEIKKVKHPYDRGVGAREGVEK